jgi:hypothetical protein
VPRRFAVKIAGGGGRAGNFDNNVLRHKTASSLLDGIFTGIGNLFLHLLIQPVHEFRIRISPQEDSPRHLFLKQDVSRQRFLTIKSDNLKYLFGVS